MHTDGDGELILGMLQLHTQARSPRITPGGILAVHGPGEDFELPPEEEPPFVIPFPPPENQELVVRVVENTLSTPNSRAVGLDISDLEAIQQVGDVNGDERFGTGVLSSDSRYTVLCGRQRAGGSGSIAPYSRALRIADFEDPNNPVVVDVRDWRNDMGLPADRRWSVNAMLYDRHRDRILLIASWNGSGSQSSLWFTTYDWSDKEELVIVEAGSVDIGVAADLSSDGVLSADGRHFFLYHVPFSNGGNPKFRSWVWNDNGTIANLDVLDIPLVASTNDNPSANGWYPVNYDPVNHRVFAGRPAGGGTAGGQTMTSGIAEIDVSDPTQLSLIAMHFVLDTGNPAKQNFRVSFDGDRLYVHDFVAASGEHHDMVIYDCSSPGTLIELHRIQIPGTLVSDRRSSTHAMQFIGAPRAAGIVLSVNVRVRSFTVVGDVIIPHGDLTLSGANGEGVIAMAFGSNVNPWTPELG